MEPGWKLMKDLAKSGNIGRVAVTDIDFTNSLTSGETSVGFFAEPGWAAVAKTFPVTRLTKAGWLQDLPLPERLRRHEEPAEPEGDAAIS